MTEEESIPAVVERPFAPRTFFATLPVWKKTMIAGAVMMLVAAVVTTFITGSLPNAALAGLGLFTGFKKNR